MPFGRDADTDELTTDTNQTGEAGTGITGVTFQTNSASALPSGNVNFLVVKLDFTGAQNTATFYVDPDPLDIDDNGFASAALSFSGSINRLRILANNDHFSGDYSRFVDEIRVATTFEELSGSIPEPASLALIGLGGLLTFGRSRKTS